MNVNEYQELAMTTLNPEFSKKNIQIENMNLSHLNQVIPLYIEHYNGHEGGCRSGALPCQGADRA